MPVCNARQFPFVSCALRTSRIAAVVGALLFAGGSSLQNAAAIGETRTLTMRHLHTKETITVTYMRDGRYDSAGLAKLNWFLRDWRRNQQIEIDPQLLDIMWEVNLEVGGKQPIEIICGYRSPDTNAMLRRRSRGVARMSQHTLGKAIDFYIPGVPLEEQRIAGLRLQRGGVGYYPSSGSPFVHLDVGSIRHWPRMTHDQLARVFPNGQTVHVPSDGRPLPGYALALADVERRGRTPSQTSLVAARDAGIDVAAATPKRNVIAQLLGVGADEDEETAAPAVRASAPVAAPLPRTRPTRPGEFALASAQTEISAARTASVIPADVPLPRSRPGQMAPEFTASVTPAAADRVPADLALAYAIPSSTDVPTTLAAPLTPRARMPASSNSPQSKVAQSYESPWTRGLILTPSVRDSMSVAMFGAPDYRHLAPLMEKPGSSLALVFSADPYFGLADQTFSGTAVAFMPTITFGMRTAALSTALHETPATLAR